MKEQKIIKFFRPTIKSVDSEKLTATVVVSTKKTDRDGDVLKPEAFKSRLKHYKEHPILLSSHDYHDLRKQIGEAVKITPTDDGMEVTFKWYAGEGNPEADWAWKLAEKGIASFSVGFMAFEYEWLKDKTTGNITGREFTDVELLEISQVVVPSNRGALQESRSFAQEQGELAELCIKSMEKGEISEVAPAAAPAVSKEKTDSEEKHYSEYVTEKGGNDRKPISKVMSEDSLDPGVVQNVLKNVLENIN